MMKEFTVTGLWRFPNGRKKWAGTLSYSPLTGAALELVGSAKEIDDLSGSIMTQDPAGYQDIILGQSPARSAYEFLLTLSGCYGKWPVYRPSYKGSLRLHFYVKTVIVGKHFTSRKKLEFKKVLVDFTHLFEWVNISGVKSGIDVREKLDEVDALIEYKRPAPIPVSVGDYKISLYFEREPRWETWLDAKEESCIKQRVYAMIDFNKKQSLETLEEVCYHFRNFLSLGVSQPVYPQEIKIRLDGRSGPQDIEFFVVCPNYVSKQKRLAYHEMLFSYADISARYEYYLYNWVDNSDRLKPVYDLFFGVSHNPSAYLIQTFLSYAQALETYHRRLAEKKYQFTDDAKKTIIQDVLNRSGSKYKVSDLQNRKEPSLLMRILELLKIHEDVCHPIIEYGRHFEFAEFIKDKRNYYTHLNPKKDSSAPARLELWKANERMRFLLQVCLLFELGLNEDQIKKFSRRGDFHTLVSFLQGSGHVIHIPLERL
jgi:hypothetical protein